MPPLQYFQAGSKVTELALRTTSARNKCPPSSQMTKAPDLGAPAMGEVRTMAIIIGTNDNDQEPYELYGTNLADEIYGLAGDDTLVGLDGDDVLEGGAGADEIFGSSGFNYASYKGSPAGVAIDLQFSIARHSGQPPGRDVPWSRDGGLGVGWPAGDGRPTAGDTRQGRTDNRDD